MLKKKSHGIQPVSMRMEFEDRTAYRSKNSVFESFICFKNVVFCNKYIKRFLKKLIEIRKRFIFFENFFNYVICEPAGTYPELFRIEPFFTEDVSHNAQVFIGYGDV
jgi:hypothetical protein